MDLTPWAPLIALGGVALGSVVTFVGQWLTRRQSSELSIASQKAALRNDRREAIYDFLGAVQACHDVMSLENRSKEGHLGSGEIDFHARARVIGQLWFRLACVKVLCREELVVAANRCVSAIVKAVGRKDMATDQMTRAEAEFMLAARLELYTADVFD